MKISFSHTVILCSVFLFCVLVLNSCGPTDANEPTPNYSLDVQATPKEAGTVEPSSGSFKEGSKVEVKAIPNSGWSFKQWRGISESEENPVTITINKNLSLEAEFQRVEYSLKINIEGEGSVDEEVFQTKNSSYEEGTEVQLTALPAKGWKFMEWKRDITGSENPTTILIDENEEVTAVFAKKEFSVSIETGGEGTVSRELISGEETSNGYLYGSEIRLLAEPNEGWLFQSWTGDTASTENPIIITVLNDFSVKANFEIEGYTLFVETDGEGNVKQEIVQAKDTNYEFDTTVELSAIAAEGWNFNHWSGDLSGEENPKSLIMDQNKSVIAHFNRNECELQLSKQGEGEVSSTLVSGSQTDKGYLFESVIEIEADPDEHWFFSKWKGDINTDTNPFEVTVTSNTFIEAIFKPIIYPIAVDIEGEGSISQSLISGSEFEDGYQFGSEVELTAIPNEGWEFSTWSGDISTDKNPITIEISGSNSITAIFTRKYYELNISNNGSGSVQTDLIDGDINSENKFTHNSEVKLQAVPDKGWMFSNWDGDLAGESNPISIVMDSDKSVTANYEEIQLEYSVGLTFEDSKGSFEMRFGQDRNPSDRRRLAPPPPPSGSLNAFFVFENENYIRDYRKSSETTVTWELHYEAGDGDHLNLNWDVNDADIKGDLSLTDNENSFEIDMLDKNSLDLSEKEEGILFIDFKFDN